LFLQNWYCLAKTLAELEAFEYAKKSGLDVVTVCPSLVIGPLLQPTVNTSSSVIVDFLTGLPHFAILRNCHFHRLNSLQYVYMAALGPPMCGKRPSLMSPDLSAGDHEVKTKIRNFVDVRDLADALVLVYENPEVSGRYVCNSHATKVSHVIDLLKSMYPAYKFASK
jgi:nucleoside-diphosphate-sugar epimerase